MTAIDWTPWLWANLAVFAGAAVQAAIGYGMNLIAVPLLLAIDATLIPGPLLVAHLLLVLLMVGFHWSRVDRRVLFWAGAASVPGAILGAVVLVWMPHGVFVAFTLLTLLSSVAVASGSISLGPSARNLSVAGFVSGLCGSTTSINGPQLAAVMVESSTLAAVRATLAAFLLFSTVVSLGSLSVVGRFGTQAVVSALALAPGVLLGLACSRLTLGRLLAGTHPRTVFLVSALAALALYLVREWRAW